MSPKTLRRRTKKKSTAPRPRRVADASVMIDTSSMSRGQQAALEVAEAARDQSEVVSFAGTLLMGELDLDQLMPFPEQAPADRKIGDELVARVTDFLRTHLDPEVVDETRTIPVEVVEGLRDMGVLKMKVPVEYGGLGFSQVNYNRVMLTIASHCASTAVLVSAHQSIGVPQPLKMFGTDEQKARFFPRISAGALSAFALTEPGVGSDPARMETTATPTEDGRHWIINGEKLWTTNGPIAQLLVVMAQTPPTVRRGRERRAITAFIVDTDTPGVTATHRCDFMGLRAIQNGVIRFENVLVPAENLLLGEGKGLRLALKTLNTGRLTLPAACTGLGKQCLAIVRKWGAQREQWGQPIGRHEAGSEKISSIAATTFAMDAVTALTSHWADHGRDIRIEAAMAKLFTSEASWRVVDETMQFRGGRGYERATSLRERGEAPYPVERMMRDCRINRIIEGTTDIMRLFLAREALDPHLKLAVGVLDPQAGIGEKIRAACGALGVDARWYPGRILGGRGPFRYRGRGPLAREYRKIDRLAHRFAAALLHKMGRHGPKLEREQIVLGHLMEIGTELFTMAATCAYADHLARSNRNGDAGAGDPRRLAAVFCDQARRRVDEHFRALGRGRERGRMRTVSRAVLDGSYRWMEDGIIPVVSD